MAEERLAKIKNMVLKAVGEKYNLEKFKNYFKKDIDSLRAYKKIGTIVELITVLEQRDVLNAECLMPLFHIGDILENEEIKTAKEVYLKYIHKDNKCRFCGEALDHHNSSPTLQSEGNTLQQNPDVINDSNKDLKDAIKNVADRISFWRVLASELKIKENVIDQILAKYPKNEQMQAFAALEHWVKREKENATIESLDKALNARLCQNKGIGSHLRMPLSCLNL